MRVPQSWSSDERGPGEGRANADHHTGEELFLAQREPLAEATQANEGEGQQSALAEPRPESFGQAEDLHADNAVEDQIDQMISERLQLVQAVVQPEAQNCQRAVALVGAVGAQGRAAAPFASAGA